MDQTETTAESKSQLTDQERLRAEEQAKVLRAFSDRLSNIVAPPAGYQELRQIGRTNIPTPQQDLDYLIGELTSLIENVTGALSRANRGQPLPEIQEEGDPMIDLKYTRY